MNQVFEEEELSSDQRRALSRNMTGAGYREETPPGLGCFS